eukprot:6192286-Pleurochrysis_carterae.AAC.2
MATREACPKLSRASPRVCLSSACLLRADSQPGSAGVDPCQPFQCSADHRLRKECQCCCLKCSIQVNRAPCESPGAQTVRFHPRPKNEKRRLSFQHWPAVVFASLPEALQRWCSCRPGVHHAWKLACRPAGVRRQDYCSNSRGSKARSKVSRPVPPLNGASG